ncbi:MAG: hypothetical protein KKF65_00330 [Nanoarchaeota archaeon]|nr:hypothetical protein [Nanoarchaeota archaeon]
MVLAYGDWFTLISSFLYSLQCICPFLLFGLLILFYLLFQLKRSSEINKKELKFEHSKMVVPLVASSIKRRKGYTPVFFLLNNINPKMVFYDTYLEYLEGRFLSFSLSKRGYTEIEKVEAHTLSEPKIQLYFREYDLIYVAIVPNQQILKGVLIFLQKKGCMLSSEAKKIIKKSS